MTARWRHREASYEAQRGGVGASLSNYPAGGSVSLLGIAVTAARYSPRDPNSPTSRRQRDASTFGGGLVTPSSQLGSPTTGALGSAGDGDIPHPVTIRVKLATRDGPDGTHSSMPRRRRVNGHALKLAYIIARNIQSSTSTQPRLSSSPRPPARHKLHGPPRRLRLRLQRDARTFQFSAAASPRAGAHGTFQLMSPLGDHLPPLMDTPPGRHGNDRGDYTTPRHFALPPGETAELDLFLPTTSTPKATRRPTRSKPSAGASRRHDTTLLSIVDNETMTGATNPIDATAFFVRQHYVDFLNREPDAAGLAFWTNNIESCGADASCREARRVDTSAAFFLSIEFQNTGFLVHRLYRSAFNRFARYREFLRDFKSWPGVVVAQGRGRRSSHRTRAVRREFITRADFPLDLRGGRTTSSWTL